LEISARHFTQLGGCADRLCPFICSHVSGLMRFLTADKTQQHVSICEKLCQIAFNDETFLSRVITGNKSWIYGYDRDKATSLPMENEEQSQEHIHHFL
jgi:hypothetical protein